MKTPKLGISDFGYYDSPDSPVSLTEWMKEVTARVNRLERHVYGKHLPKHVITLSAKQAEVYTYIRVYIDEHDRSPTLQEIADNFGYSGLSSAQRMVDALISKGLVERKGHQLLVAED